MTMRTHSRHRRPGVVIVFVALALPFILLLAAFAVDMAYLKLARRELENTADTTARAAMSEFARTGDVTVSRAAALNVASLNYVASEPMRMSAEDIEFGRATEGVDGLQFVPDEKSPNAVRVQARRTADSMAGPIKLFFARSFGKVNIEMVQSATARGVPSDTVLVINRGRTMAYPPSSLGLLPRPYFSGVWWNWCSTVHPDSRFAGTMSAVDKALAKLESEGSKSQVALVTYGVNATYDVEFTTDYNLIRQRLSSIASAYCKEAGEDLAGAIHLATDVAEAHRSASPSAQAGALLITDNSLLLGDAVLSADRARAKGVEFDVASFSNPDLAWLYDLIAQLTKGAHLSAGSKAELESNVKQLMSKVHTNLMP